MLSTDIKTNRLRHLHFGFASKLEGIHMPGDFDISEKDLRMLVNYKRIFFTSGERMLNLHRAHHHRL